MNETNIGDTQDFLESTGSDSRLMGNDFAIGINGSNNTPAVSERTFKGSEVTQTLFTFGLNHKTAPVEIREKLYLNEGLVNDAHFFSLISCAACQQLFKVATSIDSKVIGDSQILRQLREAYSIAMKEGQAGKVVNQLLQRALNLGKAAYAQTSIHDGAM